MIEIIEHGFIIKVDGKEVIRHTDNSPAIYIGNGKATYNMYRGNFEIDDYLQERIPLKMCEIKKNNLENIIKLSSGIGHELILKITGISHELKIDFISEDSKYNRMWIRIPADKDEKIYGCGEQMSYFNLRGKNFPIWTSEPGVGRNKNTYVTWQADVKDKAGGDYYTTNYPEPTFISTKKYFCHLSSTAYLDFDFRNENYHELQCWDVPKFIIFKTGKTYLELQEKIGDYFGKQPELPEWVYNGVILASQGGTEKMLKKIQNAMEKGVEISGIWCQDWQGKRITSFGKRLNWNWKWNSDEYPNLDKEIFKLKEKGIRFLGYINPYVVQGYDLYQEAKSKKYLATKEDKEDYTVDFGEFYCGVVDFTNEEAKTWYKEVIKKNLIEFGLDGWMADFGEYLPTDCVLSNGISPEIMHNAWPAIWAQVNYEAVEESGKLGEVLYFMRAGFTGNQKYCTLMWAGDQSVDWSLDDGLASVIPAALSVGITGNGLSHSDIGGYTTLHGMKRTKELFQRWTEMAAFTPIMRLHEGNRPDDNWQFDSDDETIAFLGRFSKVYKGLTPYLKELVHENATKGIPVQRPLFYHYENDIRSYDIKYQYMYGPDILVAPVYNEGAREWSVHLPSDKWVNLWTQEEYLGGEVVVESNIGYPPVFYRKDSKYKELFKKIGRL